MSIDRENIARDIGQLDSGQQITLGHQQARDLIDLLPDEASDLMEALDFAQGEQQESRRYVVIYITPEVI